MCFIYLHGFINCTRTVFRTRRVIVFGFFEVFSLSVQLNLAGNTFEDVYFPNWNIFVHNKVINLKENSIYQTKTEKNIINLDISESIITSPFFSFISKALLERGSSLKLSCRSGIGESHPLGREEWI